MSIDSTHSLSDSSPRAGWRCFRALLPGFMLANLEGALVNVVLPTLQRELELSLAAVSWVPLACLLPTAALCPVLGIIADRVGRRRIYLLGLWGVGMGSALAAAAPGLELLIAARALQGIGASALIANGLAIVAEQFEAHERGRALGLMTAVVGLGAIVAPPLGGAIAGYLGWRGVFVVNMLAAIPGIVWVLERIPPDRPPSPGWTTQIPWGAATSLVVAASAGIIALWGAGRGGAGSGLVIAGLVTAVVAGGVTVVASRRAPVPLIDAARLPARTAWSLVALTSGSVALGALSFALPLHLAAHLHIEALELGLQIVPFPLGLVFGAVLGGRIGDRRGTRGPVLAGLFLFIVGVAAWSAVHLSLFPPGAAPGASMLSAGVTVLLLALSGAGMGAFSVGNNAEVVHGHHQGLGSITGLTGLLRLGGQLSGVALTGAVLSARGAASSLAWIGLLALPAVLGALLAYRDGTVRR